uniref:SFRICE_033719 n=1 Tax=Spodoptera frugiperda TaxID=7108 RepID=A0A2H1VDW0_SPOFR
MSVTIKTLIHDCTVGAVAGQLAAVQRVAGRFPHGTTPCDPQIVVSGLGVMLCINGYCNSYKS